MESIEPGINFFLNFIIKATIVDISTNKDYDKKISDLRLAVLKKKCPECNTLLTATGNMYHSTVTLDWFVEYWCPEDKEMLYIWNPENESLTAAIAKQSADDVNS